MTVESANDIFSGHRALGLVCNSLPFAITFQKKRGEYLIFTAVGRHFHCYGVRRNLNDDFCKLVLLLKREQRDRMGEKIGRSST